MPRYKHYSYQQGQFIPIQFEHQILPDTFEYALNYIVDNVLDLRVFHARIKNDETGAPAYDPAILLKIVLYGYARGIMQSRQIERCCRENVMFMALSANTRPHFTTIANFISSVSEVIRPLFLDVLMYCDKLGLIGKEMFAIDGCKISSNASKEWSGTREDFEKKKRKYEESIGYLMKKHREEDEKGEAEKAEREKEEKAAESMEKKVEKIRGWLEEHEDKVGASGKIKKSHLIDNESAKMVSSHGVVQGYNGISVVDGKHQVVVGAEAYGEGSEREVLEPMIEEVEESFRKMGEEEVYKKAKVAADSGFHSEKNIKMLFDKEIDAYVADNQFRKRDPRFETAERHKKPIDRHKTMRKRKYFSPDDFRLEEKSGKLICPAGKEMYVRNRNFKTPNGFYGTAYMAKITDCRVCQLRGQCLQKPWTVARQVTKFEGRDVGEGQKGSFTQKMIKKIDTLKGRTLYSQRMGIVEPVFANIRHMLGLDRFTLKGRQKVSAQWKLYNMVHNMLKAYRFGWQATGAG